jgi:hypothetical protein
MPIPDRLLGLSMDEKDIGTVARKMIELFGTDAENVAAGRAELFAAGDKIEESVAWERVAALVREMQHKK